MLKRAFYLAALVLSLSFLQATAQTGPPPDVTAVAMKLNVIPRKAELTNFDDKYTRLIVTLPSYSTNLMLNDQQIAYKKRMVDWLKTRLIGSATRSVLITANATVAGQTLPQQPIFYQMHGSGSTSQEYYAVAALTPYSTASRDPIHLEIRGKYKNELTSNLVSSTVSVLAFAAKTMNTPGALLTQFSKESYKSAAVDVDKAIADIFGGSNEDKVVVDFDPARDERVDLTVPGPPGGSDDVIATIVLEVRDSLISRTGELRHFPIARDDITKFSISDGTKSLPISKLVNALPSVITPTNPDARFPSPQMFCDAVSEEMAGRGLNKFDRAAVLYSYLIDSPWNFSVDYRSPNSVPDACESRVQVLAGTNLTGLNSEEDIIKKEEENAVPTERLFAIRIRSRLDEVLRGNDIIRARKWPVVVPETIRLNTNFAVKLGNGTLLEPGVGITVDPLDVPGLLSNSAFSRDTTVVEQDCYGPYVNTAKAGKFRSAKRCTSVMLADGTVAPAEIEFEFNRPITYANLKSVDGVHLVQMRMIVSPKIVVAAAPASSP